MSEPPTHTSVDDVHAHPRHSGIRTFDLMLAMSAILISAVSLFISVQHGKTDRQLVEANSWPMLQAHGSFNSRGRIKIIIKNAGVGPAKLESFQVLFNGKPVASVRTLLQECCDVPPTHEAEQAAFEDDPSIYTVNGTVLRPGEEDTILELVGSEAKRTATGKFFQAGKNITYQACYCSVFDQCWMSTLTDLHPRSVEQCPEHTPSFNDNVM